MSDETYEIQLDTVGQEAVQQTLDALGVKAEKINAEVGGQGSEVGGQRSEVGNPVLDLSTTNALLERIAAAVERQPVPILRTGLLIHPSSLIFHPSSFIFHPSSLILHPSSFPLWQSPANSRPARLSRPRHTARSSPVRAALRKQHIDLVSQVANADGTVTVTLAGRGLGPKATPAAPPVNVSIENGQLKILPIE